MALVQCKECGREISDRAIACPQCGDPKRMASSSKGILILLGVLVCVLVLLPAVGILFALLAPNASYPIEVELPQRSASTNSLQADCIPRDACVSMQIASR
ncbi:hypothetical protein CMZ82_14540 [Lysobacteraceae bacterium NML93-0792]|nr:hypothetical protein CMZ82_14540 [Xanthomonadaceae bacterium NML93-0792]PBS14570.1 hypothetical protein CMZ81_15150 [Xanthomonadaceae bacterium NML93-0793]PBS20290.1 hypothetical protein CMZ80_00015 [Xanthomonadaceae bacterium NML93-0831]